MDDRLEAGYGEQRIRKDAVKMVEATVQLGGDITKESEEKIEALKEAYEELKEMYGEENIIRSDPRKRDNAPSVLWFCAVDQAGNLSAKDVIGDKENAQDAREIFEAMQERVPALNLHVWSRRAII